MLWSLFLNHQGRIAHKWAHYFPVYERFFGHYVNQPVTFIEIGCGEGGSLQLWKHYFGPYARIIGLDNRPECQSFEEEQISVRIGEQAEAHFLASILQEFGTPDIVLDDGSHFMTDQIASFEYLYPRLSPTGLYVAEDLHTSYWKEYGGGLSRPDTFIEYAKTLIDQLNADHTRGALAPAFGAHTLAIHFYDSLAVFERGAPGRKYHLKTGKPAA